ncbi:MAG TPA: peptidylprolyl isomerase, partial [Vicinamibacteria bacterium]
MQRLIGVGVLLAACGTAPERDPWRGGPPSREIVGWIDDQAVTYGEVARYVRTKEPESFARGLEGLVLERVTMAEAEPLGVTAPRAAVLRESARRMREWEQNVRGAAREQTGEEIDPALWLQRVAGVSLAELQSWVEHHTEVELVQDRLLRYELMTSATVEISLLLVETEERAKALRAEALQGDFAALARANSIHPSAPEGGRIPGPLVQADVADAAVRAALFGADAGAVLGPFPTRAGEKDFWQLYRVDAKAPRREGTYEALAREVARDLETRPVPVAEYERWRTRILVRHGFLAAAGES